MDRIIWIRGRFSITAAVPKIELCLWRLCIFDKVTRIHQVPIIENSSSNLNKLFTVLGGKFEFQSKNSDLEYFFWRFGDLTNPSQFLKKPPFSVLRMLSADSLEGDKIEKKVQNSAAAVTGSSHGFRL